MQTKSYKIPVILGIMCAIGTHFVLFTNSGHRLQSAIIESDLTSRAELYLTAREREVTFTTGITATNATHLRGTIQYNPDSIIVDECESPFGTMTIIPDQGFQSFDLAFTTPTRIEKRTELAHCRLTTTGDDERVVNLTNVSLEMTDGKSDLTTEGTGEF